MSRPLTLIVATTPSLGIGLKGTLPWPSLKQEMAYFARTTKRLPKSTTPSKSSTQPTQNAVIMGRNTYESIPGKFRPLKDRLNIVLTRNPEKFKGEFESAQGSSSSSSLRSEGPLVVGSMAEALSVLDEKVGRVFVIGGAEVYAQALRMENCVRVLRTRIEKEFECDVVFPVDLERDEAWRRAGQERLSEWVGEDVPEGLVEQDGIQWEYQMWERGVEGGDD